MPLGLTALLTACPPPPPVFTLYQADLVNQVGSTVTAKVDATLNTAILTIAGDITNATASDVFTSSITCSQTQSLSIGVSTTNVPITVFGSLTGTEADRTILNNQQCSISVFNAGGTLILKGFLKSRG
jgi:hypothetical protein